MISFYGHNIYGYNIYRYADLIELQNMKALEQKINDDYTTFSGLALERWFRQELTESCRYRRIGGWWTSWGKNAKGTQDDFEIDIVTETIDGDVEAYEVKVAQMQRHNFQNKEIRMRGLSMDDMGKSQLAMPSLIWTLRPSITRVVPDTMEC